MVHVYSSTCTSTSSPRVVIGVGGPLLALPVVYHQLLGLSRVDLEVIVVTPPDEALHRGSVLLLLVICDVADNGVIREHL